MLLGFRTTLRFTNCKIRKNKTDTDQSVLQVFISIFHIGQEQFLIAGNVVFLKPGARFILTRLKFCPSPCTLLKQHLFAKLYKVFRLLYSSHCNNFSVTNRFILHISPPPKVCKRSVTFSKFVKISFPLDNCALEKKQNSFAFFSS